MTNESLIKKLEALNSIFRKGGEQAAIAKCIAIVREHATAQGDLIAVLLHFANRYCPLNDDGKPEALRLITAMGEPAKASSAAIAPEVAETAPQPSPAKHSEQPVDMPEVNYQVIAHQLEYKFPQISLGALSDIIDYFRPYLDAPKREAISLTASEKYAIADNIVTESRSKSDVVQDVFDEIAERFEIRRRG